MNNIEIKEIIKYINTYNTKIEFFKWIDYEYDLYIIRVYKKHNKIVILYENNDNTEYYDIRIVNIFKKCLCPDLLNYEYKNKIDNKDFIIKYEKNRLKKLINIYFRNITYKEKVNDKFFEYTIWTNDIIFGKTKTIIIELTNDLYYKVYWIDQYKNEITNIYDDFYTFSKDFIYNIHNNFYRSISGFVIKKYI